MYSESIFSRKIVPYFVGSLYGGNRLDNMGNTKFRIAVIRQYDRPPANLSNGTRNYEITIYVFLVEFVVVAICTRDLFATGVNFPHNAELTRALALSEFDIACSANTLAANETQRTPNKNHNRPTRRCI